MLCYVKKEWMRSSTYCICRYRYILLAVTASAKTAIVQGLFSQQNLRVGRLSAFGIEVSKNWGLNTILEEAMSIYLLSTPP
jgi:hypothetical protein